MQENYTGETARTFSPFWPMFIMLVAVLISGVWQWNLVRTQCAQYKEQVSRLESSSAPAQQMDASLRLFVKDVCDIASEDPEVVAILAKYQIVPQVSVPPLAKSPPPAKAR